MTKNTVLLVSSLLLAPHMCRVSADIGWIIQTQAYDGVVDVHDFEGFPEPQVLGDVFQDSDSGEQAVLDRQLNLSIGPDRSSRASVSANYGIAHALANARSAGTGSGFGDLGEELYGSTTHSSAEISISDKMTINHPTLNGTPATISYSYYVPGTTTYQFSYDEENLSRSYLTTGYSAFLKGFSIRNGLYYDLTDLHYFYGTPGNSNSTEDDLVRVRQSIILGTPFDFGFLFAITATADAYGEGTAEVNVDYSHSVYWNGISGVSANGDPVTDFTVESQSGTDYRKSFAANPPTFSEVPDSTNTGAMAFGGFAALAISYRRQRSAAN